MLINGKECKYYDVIGEASHWEEFEYIDLLDYTVHYGERREGRNGFTRSVFGERMAFDLQKGFPILTTKKIHWKSVVVELLWFLRGGTNTKFLHDYGVTIWDEWADEKGDLGPVYGKQWRSWPGKQGPIDQIHNVIESLKKDPYGRRHIVSAWNPAEIEEMALPPCHCLFQFYISDNKLSCQLYQRSADIFLGVPFNIASYALLTHLVAKEIGREVGKFIHVLGDAHLYENHLEQAQLQLTRNPLGFPKLLIKADKPLDQYLPEDFGFENYDSHPAIKAPVSK